MAYAVAFVTGSWSVARRFGPKVLLPAWIGAAVLLSSLAAVGVWIRWPGVTAESSHLMASMLISVLLWALVSLAPVTLLLRRRLTVEPMRDLSVAFVSLTVVVFLLCGTVIAIGMLWAVLRNF